MKKLSVATGFFLVIFELFLIIFYFKYLVPRYNTTPYEEVTIEDGTNPRCSIFVSQREAQEYFDKHKGDDTRLSGLDNDSDGIACENLP